MSSYSFSAFREAVGTPFRIPLSQQEVMLQLVDVSEQASSPNMVQFSLLLRGPLEFFLPQQTYRMVHEQLGELELFMVPVGREADGFRYEIVFNLFTANR
ncbi:DUF6916 family protein [Paenibacillus allorhizosphaerae]|uniref:DUF6916 domain-containing protein n=1 Tax=Paenibacillus allorhizosphaerae TaxID=2849866 RepID=A0ABM8VF58_9BACL|nr:hypothetical protein [Paenibacillus allorhizosphaerae]CAG7633762.1 hypothetical protein PAECIP111802_01980 [Paenibacillus allorhizosphaerae]